MQVAVSIRLYGYEHEQVKLKKKRRIFFFIENKYAKRKLKK